MDQFGNYWTDSPEILYLNVFRKSVEEILVSLKRDRTSILLEDQYTFVIVSRPVLLRMRNVSDKSCRDIKKHISYSVNFSPLYPTVYAIMWRNVVQRGRTQMKM